MFAIYIRAIFRRCISICTKVIYSIMIPRSLAIDASVLIRISWLDRGGGNTSGEIDDPRRIQRGALTGTIRFDCVDNVGALISVHNCLPALNGAGSIFN